MTNGVSSEVASKQEKGEETCENIMEESEKENGEDIFSDITPDEGKENVNLVTHKTKLSLAFGKFKLISIGINLIFSSLIKYIPFSF